MEHLLPYLLFLICPISMGGMMLVMMRGNKQTPEPKAGLEERIRELEQQVHDESRAEDLGAPATANR